MNNLKLKIFEQDFIKRKLEIANFIHKTQSVKLLNNTVNFPLQEILNRIYADKDSLIILGGSLIEGIGSIYSDLDVCVISEINPEINKFDISLHSNKYSAHNARKTSNKRRCWSTHDYFSDNGMQLDIEYVELNDILKSITSIEQIFNSRLDLKRFLSSANMLPSYISYDEKEKLHRIITGIPLSNLDKYQDLLTKIPIEKICYIYFKESHLTYSDFKDFLGAVFSSNHQMAISLIHKFLNNQMKAFLHLFYNTNDKSKWIATYLNYIPDDYKNVATNFFSLINKEVDKSNFDQYIHKCLEFIDLLFLYYSDLIDKNFSKVSRNSLFNQAFNEYNKLDLTHKQINRQLAFLERFYSKNFIPAREFLDFTKVLKPKEEYL